MSLDKALSIAKNVPYSETVTDIIVNEIRLKNKIISFSKVLFLPDETYYILLFTNHTSENYGQTNRHKKDGDEYQLLSISGNGCIEIRFGY